MRRAKTHLTHPEYNSRRLVTVAPNVHQPSRRLVHRELLHLPHKGVLLSVVVGGWDLLGRGVVVKGRVLLIAHPAEAMLGPADGAGERDLRSGPTGWPKSSVTFATFDGPRTKLVKAGGSTRLGQNRPGGRFWSSRVDPERRRLA